MASPWRRTAAVVEWKGYDFRALVHPKGNHGPGMTTHTVEYPLSERLFAKVEYVTKREWSWLLSRGGKVIGRGTCTQENNARSAVMKRVRPMLDALRIKYPPDPAWGEPYTHERWRELTTEWEAQRMAEAQEKQRQGG